MDDVASLAALIGPPERAPRTGQVAVTATFTRDSVGKVCTLVRPAATRVAIAPRDIEDLLIAVSEVVTNAIRYAGGTGSITVQCLSAGLIVEIRDSGPGLPDSLVAAIPPLDFPVEGGLSRARLLCEELKILSSPLGVTVRMFTPCRVANEGHEVTVATVIGEDRVRAGGRCRCSRATSDRAVCRCADG